MFLEVSQILYKILRFCVIENQQDKTLCITMADFEDSRPKTLGRDLAPAGAILFQF